MEQVIQTPQYFTNVIHSLFEMVKYNIWGYTDCIGAMDGVFLCRHCSVFSRFHEFFFLLVQTGNESSVDRLMKQISSFMSEISDEFKIVVVEAIRSVNKIKSKQVVSCHHYNIVALKGTRSNIIHDNLYRPVIF